MLLAGSGFWREAFGRHSPASETSASETHSSSVASVKRIETFMTSRFPSLSWGIGAAGYALPANHTAAEGKARADWLLANANAVKATASRHYMWFDTSWTNGDYRIANDPVLLAQWRAVVGL